MIMVMFVRLRTGEMFDLSTTWFAVMPTAVLAQDNAPPQVARQFEKLFWQWHRLIKICQEVAK
jgi:hypothetical protein